ncbi:MAG: hypothetical protein AABY22_32830 [Nanoarchaeota archaeon]
MVKIFCDKCNNEINKDELAGNFSYLEARYTKQYQKELYEIKQIFCESCTKKVIESINGQKS